MSLAIVGAVTRLSANAFDTGTAGFGPASLDQPVPVPGPTRTSPSAPSSAQSPAPRPTPAGAPGVVAWRPPDLGTSTWRVEGGEGISPAGSVCARTYREGRMTVAGGPDAFQVDLEYVNDDGSVTHRERRFLAYSDAGVEMAFAQANPYCLVQLHLPATYTPALLAARFPLAEGLVWAGRAEDGGAATDYTAQVVGVETATVAGRTVDVFVIRARYDTAGAITATRDETWRFAPEIGLPVQWTERVTRRIGPFTYRHEATWTLDSLGG